jgi:hypothetical protein
MSTQHGTFVLLRAGTLRLLLPQADVGAAEYLEARPVPTDVPGLLRSGEPGDERTYAALSEGMTLLPECPPERFIACELAGAANPLVWCWDEVRVLIDADIEPIAVPPSMLAQDAAVTEYAELEGAPVFLCRAEELCRHAVQPLEGRDAA